MAGESIKNKWYYLDMPFAKRPMPHCNEIPIFVFSFLPNLASDDILNQPMQENKSDGSTFSDSGSTTLKAKPITQGQPNDLAQELALSKDSAEILAFHLRKHGVLYLDA